MSLVGSNATIQETASSRFRDLVDIILIAQQEYFLWIAVATALRHEHRRSKLGINVILPAKFQVPDSIWPRGYTREAATVAGLANHRTIQQATVLAEKLITPILHGQFPNDMRWNPVLQNWGTTPTSL